MWRMLKETSPAAEKPQTKPQAQAQAPLIQTDPTVMTCLHHPEEQARGVCAISGDPVCERCVREHDGVIVSFEYFSLFLQSDWIPLETVLTTPDSTEASAHLFLLKQNLWQRDKTPSYVTTHYKINVTEDHIESHVSLHIRRLDEALLRPMLEELKTQRKTP
jgi:hypothetical protein